MTENIPRRTFVQTVALAGGAWITSKAGAAETPSAASLPKLPYALDALEPVIDAKTMGIHHGKHHAAYVAGLNTALAGKADLTTKPLDDLLKGLPSVADEPVRTAIRNSGGGHWNHSLFWQTMRPPSSETPAMDDALGKAIVSTFGSRETFEQAFTDAAMKRFGSGWAWLIWQADGGLKIVSTPNQDNPLMKGVVPDADCGVPLLGLDIWEHAYYLHYQNRRADYIKAWWQVVNWPVVSRAYAECIQ